MDGPQTPYREGKPLSEIIPPDTRRQKTIAIVIASMVAGVCMWMLGGWALEMLANPDTTRPVVVPVTPGYQAGRITPAMLHGPSGDISMPPQVRSVLHVWLEACADCMPAFEAMRDLENNGGLGVKSPVINVAYGEADPIWAAKYGVSHNLVFDTGGASVVKPLGIGTFTTLVVDADGVILHRDRPDRPGYRARVRSALGVQNLEPDPAAELGDPLTLDATAVQRVVSVHRAGIKRTCWERGGGTDLRSANIVITLTVGTNGSVTQVSSTGDDPVVAKCIVGQVTTWVFPAPPSPTTIKIPFEFLRQ